MYFINLVNPGTVTLRTARPSFIIYLTSFKKKREHSRNVAL